MVSYLRSVEGVLFVLIIVISLVLAVLTPSFFTLQNAFDLLNNSAVNMIFAVGLLVVLIVGGIDISFSVGASVIQYIVVTLAMLLGGGNWVIGMGLAVFFGMLLGSINAVLIYQFRIVSIIITIATFNAFFGLLMYFTGGKSIWNIPDWLYDRVFLLKIDSANGFAALHLPVLVMAVMALLTWFILNRTGFGRQLYGYGSNPESAKRAGVSGWRIHLFAYGWLGVCASIAGLMQAHIVREVVPNALYGREFDVLAAVVLGGAVLGGGRGSVVGTLLGVCFLSLLQNGMNLLGISPYAFRMIVGAVIIISVVAMNWKILKSNLRLGGAH